MIDVELIQYAAEFRFAIIGEQDSARMCAAISGPLGAALAVMGIPVTVMESDLGECNHVFLKLSDGRVLDPTADQFNWGSAKLPGVYLGHPVAIHLNAVERPDVELWKPLLQEFKRLAPLYLASEVGDMVRLALETLPADLYALTN